MFTRPSENSACIAEPASQGAAAIESEVLFSQPFVLMLCVQFGFGLSYSCFFLFPKYLAREFHANAGVIGAVSALPLLAGVAATPLIGTIIDRGVRRPSITYGTLVNALSALALALPCVHAIAWPLYALRAVNGVSYALVFNATVTLAADLAPPKKLSQAIGLWGAAGMVANAIAPAIAESVADDRGWGWVFLLAGVVALFASLLSLGIREKRVTARAQSNDGVARHVAASQSDGIASPAAAAIPSAFSLIADRRRAGAFVCAAAAGAGFGAMFTFTQPFALALGAQKVSSFFVGFTVSALFVRLCLGSLADNLGRRRVAFGSLVLYGLVACMTTELRPHLLFAVGAGLGCAHGLLYPALNALAAEGVPRERRGAVMSYFAASFYGGFALWVLGLGAVAKTQGYPFVFLVTGLVVWSALACLPRGLRGRLGA